MSAVLAVIAKAPVPGRVKTRLTPPLTPEQAAALAEAALRDTLDAMRATPALRRVVVLDGEPGPWLGAGIEVIAQRGGGLDERLAAAFEDLAEPALVIGMDTPQVTPELLSRGLRALDEHPAVLGPAADGGYWAIGLRDAGRAAGSLHGVPMSSAGTLTAQRARLAHLGIRPAELPALLDVDDLAAACAVAQLVTPSSAFARAVAALPAIREAA